ncbi:MAG: Ig-like domain-containing protein, partial [Tepidisphaeraceae bacterium]
NGDIGVRRDAFIAADVSLPTPGAGVDPTTLNSTTVLLYRTSDRAVIPGVLNTSGGGDAIVLTPSALLDANTSYTFEVTDCVKDISGAAFVPFSMTFTTGALGGETDPSLAFEKIALPTATGQTYTAVTFGPDGKLYAATIDGVIQRFSINADGTLGAPQNITSLQTKEGGPRLLTGLVFDPAATAGSLILWASHNQFTDVTASTADDWTGKISKLTGANLQNVTTAVINLPRSVRDHLTNQMVFGPDGALYISQGSNTAMGAPDNAWGLRSEHLLNGAILRLDTTAVGGTPIDVMTDSGGTYNPYASGAPLTLYATGVRNAYDLVWRNGKLFAATNGSAAGGNTPASPAGSTYGANQRIDFPTRGTFTSPGIPGLTNVPQTQSDYIFNVVQGGYYGHPNLTRGEFVLNGGNPTSGVDLNEVSAYPVGTLPDRNYRGNITGSAAAAQGSAYAFGLNYSPNGILEYKGSAFGNSLKGKLLVAAYSGADEVFVLTVDSNGNVINRQGGIAGLTHFTDPLDIVESPATGFLYVSEFGAQKLTLVRPITPGANVSTDKSQMVFNDATTAGASPAQKITITNTGTSALAFPSDGLTVVGVDAARFSITQKPTLPTSIAPGESVDVLIAFTATTVDDIRVASLQIKSNDPDTSTVLIPLRGLGMSTLTGGLNEPSLQQIMDLYRIPITVGDSTPSETNLNVPPVAPNDEIEMPILLKEGNGPVTIETLAVFGVGDSTIPTFRFGYYTPGNKNDTTELLKVVGVNNSQSVNPTVQGVTSFDPGSSPFGLYSYWQRFTATGSPTVYSEDRLNQAYDAANPRKLRFYALRTPEGTIVPNAFVFAWEEFNNGTDQQDFVGIIRNVRAAPAGAEIGIENLDGVPFSNHLAFNRIQNPGNVAPIPDNIVHDTGRLRIRNTGTSDLTISSIVASSGWTVTGAPASPLTPGQFVDVTVTFVANPGGSIGRLLTGTLTINSNDADEPTTNVSLAGWWQPQNEGNDEPFLDQIATLFGYESNIPNSATFASDGGKIIRHGDEVLSPYWNRADTSLGVTVQQLAAFHSQSVDAKTLLRWHLEGSTTTTTIFQQDADEGQSFLPHKENAVIGSVSANYAIGTFTPSNTFGFRIDNEWSDPTKNPQPVGEPQDEGHHVRFFMVRDQSGNVIPNTYIMSMDYTGINYDFQDNVYLIRNIKPNSAPAKPAGLAANASGAGISLNWNDSTEPNLAGYNIYRASSELGTYTKLNSELVTGSDYLDVTAPLGSTSWYYVTAVDTTAGESAGSDKASATRVADTNPPAAPTNLFANGSSTGIALDWANNTEADLAGYHVYRSDSVGGTYVLLNGLLSTSSFFDSAAPVGQVSYYRVSAVDTSGNESAVTPTNATRPSSDTTAPSAPTGLGATGAPSGITVDWSNNAEGDLAGYNIYRSEAPNGTYVKLNSSLLGVSSYFDASAPAGVASYYRVTAVDLANNESVAAQTNATRPADSTAPAQPAGLGLTASPSGIALNWSDNSESDLAGYYVYRSDASDGVFTKLNTTILLASNYTDTTAPQGVASYYRVTAVDASNNESTPATGNATRPIPDTFPPATPAGLTATAGAIGNALDWANNIEPDLAGYNVYRASSAGGPWTRLNAGPIGGSAFVDAGAPAGTSFYRVSAVDDSNNESGFATADATRIASYTQVDIGSPAPAGSLGVVTEGTDYNLVGGGTDVYGTSDSFSFGYQQVSGDFDIKVRLAGMTNTNAFAKAGLMARESLVANSRNAFVLATPGSNGHRFTYRTSTGGSTTSTGSGAVNYPNNWLRLVRAGNTFTGFRSTDGVTWVQVGSSTISMGNTVFFGMAAVSKNASAATTAQFRGLAGTGAPADPAPAQPVDLVLTGEQEGIKFEWSDNNEPDLAGYNVYRSSSINGMYTKLNASPFGASGYYDVTAPVGQTMYYRVVA